MFEFDHPKQKCLIFVHTLITMATVLFAPVKEFEEGEIENKCKLVSRNSDNGSVALKCKKKLHFEV